MVDQTWISPSAIHGAKELQGLQAPRVNADAANHSLANLCGRTAAWWVRRRQALRQQGHTNSWSEHHELDPTNQLAVREFLRLNAGSRHHGRRRVGGIHAQLAAGAVHS